MRSINADGSDGIAMREAYRTYPARPNPGDLAAMKGLTYRLPGRTGTSAQVRYDRLFFRATSAHRRTRPAAHIAARALY